MIPSPSSLPAIVRRLSPSISRPSIIAMSGERTVPASLISRSRACQYAAFFWLVKISFSGLCLNQDRGLY